MASGMGGVAGWLMGKWQGRRTERPRLALLDRITLAPRQSLALVEAEGRRILVATSAEGGPAFYPLEEAHQPPVDRNAVAAAPRLKQPHRQPRVSW